MRLNLDLDRKKGLFAPLASALLRADKRRIIIVGARGWIGRTLLELLRATLSADEFDKRVICFGSAEADIVFDDGCRIVQKPICDLAKLPAMSSMIFYLAFLSRQKVGSTDEAAYCFANQTLAQMVCDSLGRIEVDRLFVASSGAAALASDAGVAADMQLCGRLKREDERRFAAWVEAAPTLRRVAIGRIYSLSGPWINKHETYPLASFILDVLNGRPVAVRAPRRELRSYVAVRELLSVVVAMLLLKDGAAVQSFSTGGDPLEIGDVAATVARVCGGIVLRAPITETSEDRYVGDAVGWTDLLARYDMIHLPLGPQVAETTAWLARKAESI